jgi:hypothetical protein
MAVLSNAPKLGYETLLKPRCIEWDADIPKNIRERFEGERDGHVHRARQYNSDA